MLSMDARVRFTLRLPDGGWRGWGWIITTEAFFIFSPGHAEEPPLKPDTDPREVSSHDLGESYAAIVQGPSTVNRSAAGLEMGSAIQVSYAAAV